MEGDFLDCVVFMCVVVSCPCGIDFVSHLLYSFWELEFVRERVCLVFAAFLFSVLRFLWNGVFRLRAWCVLLF
jgi:hypothetical protein